MNRSSNLPFVPVIGLTMLPPTVSFREYAAALDLGELGRRLDLSEHGPREAEQLARGSHNGDLRAVSSRHPTSEAGWTFHESATTLPVGPRCRRWSVALCAGARRAVHAACTKTWQHRLLPALVIEPRHSRPEECSRWTKPQ